MIQARRSPESQGGNGGFTLLEVLAAVAVLSLAFVILLTTEGQNLRRAAHASRLMEASQMARERMEEVLESGSDKTAGEEPLSKAFMLSSSVSETEYTGLSEVRVTVKWMEGGREESYHLVAYAIE